jgi:hypothetical protein
MSKIIKVVLKGLISVTLIASCSVAADTKEIDEAVKKYYAGFPDEAISILKPVALSGDVDAQYLLGNILYSLSKTGKFDDVDDPVKWYQMAAAQKSGAANYALGIIFHDRWRKSRNKQEAANAIIYYQKAVESGYIKAQASLNRIKSRSGVSQQQAAALVKLQGTKSIPEAKIQLPEKEIAKIESVETQAAADNSVAKQDTAIESESIVEPETEVDDSKQIAQTAEKPDDEVTMTVTLAEIANQCQNYTEAGFNLYTQTIKGALFSGKASLVATKPDSSKSEIYSVKLANNQFGIVIFVDLQDVPKEIAASFVKGIKYEITGSVVDSRVVSSNCAVNLIYQSVKG